MKNFQIVVIIIFIALAILGILVFAGYIKIGKSAKDQGPTGTVIVWGTTSSKEMKAILRNFTKDINYKINYVGKSPLTYEQDLLEAMAIGKGPDLFFISNESFYKFRDKIYNIPYITYPLVTFHNNFAPAGEIFLDSKGIYVLPTTIDPLILYYNRTILDSNNLAYPPSYWDEFGSYVDTLLRKDNNNQIVQSPFALGQFSNISHAKNIISAMFMQTGNTITYKDGNNYFHSGLDLSIKDKKDNVNTSFDFYTNFSDPLSNLYSWNKSMPLSIEAFSKEILAFYFGLTSDLQILLDKNPNQNFQITTFPQIRDSKAKVTYGKVEGIAIYSFTKNKEASLAASLLLSDTKFVDELSKLQNIAPARRDLLAKPDLENKYLPILYSSALFSKSWVDPSSKGTDEVFSTMVENVLSNKMKTNESILNASSRITNLLY